MPLPQEYESRDLVTSEQEREKTTVKLRVPIQEALLKLPDNQLSLLEETSR